MGGLLPDEITQKALQKLKGNSRFSFFATGQDLDWEKLGSEVREAGIIIQYQMWGSEAVVEDIVSLIELTSKKTKTVLYEEARSLGAGGFSVPSMQETLYYGFLFTISAISTGFLSKAGSDLYDKIVSKIIQIRKKIVSKDAIAVRVNIDEVNSVVYIFQSSLSSDEAIEAFRILKGHFDSIKDNVRNGDQISYFYDRNSKNWVSMN